MSPPEDKVQCLHPDPDKAMPRISRKKYDLVMQAILQAVSMEGDGIFFRDLAGQVGKLIPAPDLETLGSVSWYTTTIKLDLEARGLIERIPGSHPQRIKLIK